MRLKQRSRGDVRMHDTPLPPSFTNNLYSHPDSLRNLTESGIQWYSVQGFFIRRPVSTVHEKSDSNMKFIMNSLIDILKGAVMGLANVIPGVSGGTMMVAMGIYDKLIYSITHIFKEFKKAY